MPRLEATRQRRRWFQFSLRTLLIVVAAVAGCAFAYVKIVEPYRLQREAMAAITTLGGSFKTEDATGWMRYLDKNAQDVIVVDLADCDKPDEYLRHLVRLPRLRTLVLGGHSVGDEQVAALRRIESLNGLVLDSTNVTNACVEGLKETHPALVVWKSERRACAELAEVGEVRWGFGLQAHVPPQWLRTEVDDTYSRRETVVAFFAKNGAESHCDDTSLHNVTHLSNLQWLDLSSTNISDKGVRYVPDLPQLLSLDLYNTQITDKSVPFLAACKRLERLSLGKTGISPSEVQRLKAVLPKCDILC